MNQNDHPLSRLVGDTEHLFIDTKAPGYVPLLSITREGDRLAIRCTMEVNLPLAMLDDVEADAVPIAMTELISERVSVDMRLEGAAEIRAFLLDNPVTAGGYDGQGHA